MSSKSKLKDLKKPEPTEELTGEEKKELFAEAQNQMMEYKDKPSRIKRIMDYLQKSPIGLTIGTIGAVDKDRDEYLKDLVD
jgi:ribosomal protein L29